jgi:hypothetical protein
MVLFLSFKRLFLFVICGSTSLRKMDKRSKWHDGVFRANGKEKNIQLIWKEKTRNEAREVRAEQEKPKRERKIRDWERVEHDSWGDRRAEEVPMAG